jgi:hypothetical protein
MKQTSVEWFIEQIKEYDFLPTPYDDEYLISIPRWIFDEKVAQAKEMHKEEIVEFAYMVYREKDNADNGYVNVEEYYEETFGSKVGNTLENYHIVDANEMVELFKQEISDEEIEKAASEYADFYQCPSEVKMCKHDIISAWNNAIKWYREQLKQK